MATVRQRDEDTTRMHHAREWPIRNESLRAIVRPVIGLPARPDSALSQRRPSDSDSKAGGPKSMLGRSHSAGATSVHQREIRHIPKLSVSSESGESVDITDTDLRHGVHQSQQSIVAPRDVVPTLHGDKHGSAPSVHPHNDSVADMAMEIAEEVSLMCATPRPVDTDESFVSAGLNAGSARQLEEWLYVRFDSYSPAARLMDKKVTAEVLATEILARSSFPRSHGEHDTRPGKLRTPPPATLSAVHSYETRVQDNHPTASSSKRTKRKDLSIKLEEDLHVENASVTSHTALGASSVRTSSPSIHSGAMPMRREGLKSGGLMLGIFTVGAMLGSPLTTNFDQPGSGSMLAFPASSTLPSFYASSPQLSARHVESRSDYFLAPGSPWRRETPLMPRSPLVAV